MSLCNKVDDQSIAQVLLLRVYPYLPKSTYVLMTMLFLLISWRNVMLQFSLVLFFLFWQFLINSV